MTMILIIITIYIYKQDKPKAYRWSDGSGRVRMLVL